MESVLEGRPLVFVDVETNGMSHVSGHVIEVGAIRVEHGEIVQSFSKLVDPGRPIPGFITRLTGIAQEDLCDAPTFADIADELHDMLDGAVFVAHNVRFDYSFLKQEFKRVGKAFTPKQLCTVRLSRALFPQQTSHKLETLIRVHGFNAPRRHRAYDDAHVLWQFMQLIEKKFNPLEIQAAIKRQLKTPSLPKSLDDNLVANLPEAPGVYIFEDANSKPLYIGKSINIKKRVKQHFASDHAVSSEFKIAQSVANVRYIETPGELAALLLESQLVKELQPMHNKRLRKTDKLITARRTVNQAGYATLLLEEVEAIDPANHANILAVYPRRNRAHHSIEQMARDFDLCPKLLGIEKGKGPCFSYQLRRCRGACAGKESPELYNERLQIAFERQKIKEWPYKQPIIVSESITLDGPTTAIVVDQWCVIAEIEQQDYCEPVIRLRDKAFDLDTYKILTAFLAQQGRLVIRPFSRMELQGLSQTI